MKTPRATHGPAGDEFDEAASVAVLLLCEDAACARPAIQLMERVNDRLPYETRAEAYLYIFPDLSAHPETPANQFQPDVVVLAAHGNRPLPAGVKRWLDRWAKSSRGLGRALACALDRSHWRAAEYLEIQRYLRQLAARAGIDWLKAGEAEMDEDEQFRRGLDRQAGQVSSTLEQIVGTPRPPTRPGALL